MTLRKGQEGFPSFLKISQNSQPARIGALLLVGLALINLHNNYLYGHDYLRSYFGGSPIISILLTPLITPGALCVLASEDVMLLKL